MKEILKSGKKINHPRLRKQRNHLRAPSKAVRKNRSQNLGEDEDVHERNAETIFLNSNYSSHTASEFDCEYEIKNGVKDADILISNIERAVFLVLANSNCLMRYVGNSLWTLLERIEIDSEIEADDETDSNDNGDVHAGL